MVPADHPALPRPGPDFLAEARRISEREPYDAEAAADRILGDYQAHRAGDGPPHPDLDEKWVKAARSKAEKTRATARNKLVRLLRADAEAREWGEMVRDVEALYRSALYAPGFRLPILVKSRKVQGEFVPGHAFDPSDDRPGPRPAPVMVVGKHPGSDDVAAGRCLTGKVGLELLRLLQDAGLAGEAGSWYVTNLVRHGLLDPTSDALPVDWVKNCRPLLLIELMLVRPDFVLSLGAEPAKALLGEKVSVTGARNRVYELTIPAFGEHPEKAAKLMVIHNPAAVLRDPMLADDVADGFRGFARALKGDAPARPVLVDRRHVVLYKEDALRAVVDEIVARPDGGVIALDCEWHGEWWEPEGRLLSVQFSARAGEAFVVCLRSQGGVPAFHGGEEAAFAQLRRLLKSTPGRRVRVGGHFFRADLPWLLVKAGIDVRPEFAAPATAEATRTEGGFDTAYMIHAVFEDRGPFGLEDWAVKMLGVDRYDRPVDAFLDAYRAERKLKKSELGGYGMIPDEILHPYAALDADVVRELFDVFNGVGGAPGLLDRDKYGLDSRAPFRSSQAAQLAFLEMEMRGMLVDRARVDRQVEVFTDAAKRELRELRGLIGWPEFNPQSAFHVREILFGEEYSGKVDKETDLPVRQRPAHVRSLRLTPVKTTGKRGKQWERVVQDDDEDLYSPAADGETLGILGQEHEVARRIRRTRFLNKILQNPLNPPLLDKATGEPLRDDAGFYRYKGGFMKFIAPDGRVRTKFFPVETGRVSSSKPNLQNWSSSREGDYKKLLGDSYFAKLRSCFRASPGHVIVKTDIKSAELLVVAMQSNDANMIADVMRAMLPEDHPDYADQHAAKAVAAFKLDCAPTKKALEAIGQADKRKAAKNQTYGALYGRGTAALVRQCKEEGVDISEAEMEAIQRAFEERCPGATAYLRTSAARSQDPGWVTTALGRHRRSAPSDDKAVRGAAERTFMNFPVQGFVADFVAILMERLYWERERHRDSGGPHDFHFLLQLHDELDFEVPIPSIGWFVDLLKACVAGIDLPIAGLDGAVVPTLPPFRFEVDTSIYLHWGEKIDPGAGAAAGIDPALLAMGDD